MISNVDRYNKLVEQYEELFKTLESEIDLDNKVLSECLKNQIHLQLGWEILTKRICHLYDLCELDVETAYSQAVENQMKSKNRITSITEAKEFAKSDQNYRTAKKLLIEVRELKDESKGILETINSRKYILNNMSNTLVAGVSDTIL